MKLIDVYVYKFNMNHNFIINDFFSNYRLSKIKGSFNETEISKNIQIENILHEILLQKKIYTRKIQISKSENGKIKLEDFNTVFSISHSNDYLIISIGDFNHAVDIEKIDEKRLKIERKLYFDVKNRNIEEIIKTWTIKEAFVKYFDLSVLGNLKKIEIKDDIVSFDDKQLSYKYLRYSNYYISVAGENKFEINLIELSA